MDNLDGMRSSVLLPDVTRCSPVRLSVGCARKECLMHSCLSLPPRPCLQTGFCGRNGVLSSFESHARPLTNPSTRQLMSGRKLGVVIESMASGPALTVLKISVRSFGCLPKNKMAEAVRTSPRLLPLLGVGFLHFGGPWAAKAMSRYSSILKTSTAVTGQYLSRRHVGDVSARAP